MGRATLGALQSTPVGIVKAESGLTPARALLDHRQALFAQRLQSRPAGGSPGPEVIMERRGAALTDRLAHMTRKTVEVRTSGTSS